MPLTDPELRAYTSTFVTGGHPVLSVFHDDDGDWQFLAGLERQPDDIVAVHIAHLIDADPTLHAVGDLPVGWQAWRDGAGTPWHREPTPDDHAEI